MKKLAIWLIIVLFSAPVVFSDEKSKENIPIPVAENLAWHRWQTSNFVVLSLDEKQGSYLMNNIERVKSWVMRRWGFPDLKFATEFRVICVRNKDDLKKFFKLDAAHFESRSNHGGKKLNVAWLSADDNFQDAVSRLITEAALKEMQDQYGAKMGVWASRGLGTLNCSPTTIKAYLSQLQPSSIRSSKDVFEMSEEAYRKLTPEEKRRYDAEAVAICLLLRKEFDQMRFARFLASGSGERSLQQVYGYSGYGHFDNIFKRYVFFLSADVLRNVTPDSYLSVD